MTTCAIEGCDRGPHARGMCKMHYNRVLRGTPIDGRVREPRPLCEFPGCDRLNASRGLCSSHAWQRNKGNPLTPIVAITATYCRTEGCDRKPQKRGRYAGFCAAHARHLKDWGQTRPVRDPRPARDPGRLWGDQISRTPSGCWEWLGSLSTAGYGTVNLGNGSYGYAHRLSWELAHGDIPVGLHIDHLCRNRKCINPEHLEPVTPQVNARRGAAAYGPIKQKCIHGHDMTVAVNVYTAPDGGKRCRTCARMANYRRRSKAAQGERS